MPTGERGTPFGCMGRRYLSYPSKWEAVEFPGLHEWSPTSCKGLCQLNTNHDDPCPCRSEDLLAHEVGEVVALTVTAPEPAHTPEAVPHPEPASLPSRSSKATPMGSATPATGPGSSAVEEGSEAVEAVTHGVSSPASPVPEILAGSSKDGASGNVHSSPANATSTQESQNASGSMINTTGGGRSSQAASRASNGGPIRPALSGPSRTARIEELEVQSVLFRGLRIRAGIDWGHVRSDVHATTARVELRGRTMNRASRIATAVAKSGQASARRLHRMLALSWRACLLPPLLCVRGESGLAVKRETE